MVVMVIVMVSPFPAFSSVSSPEEIEPIWFKGLADLPGFRNMQIEPFNGRNVIAPCSKVVLLFSVPATTDVMMQMSDSPIRFTLPCIGIFSIIAFRVIGERCLKRSADASPLPCITILAVIFDVDDDSNLRFIAAGSVLSFYWCNLILESKSGIKG